MSSRPHWLPLTLILILTGLIFANTLNFPFVYDDHNQIENNPVIRSWHSTPYLFITHVWGHLSASGIYYRPLFLLWALATFKLFGLQPAGWHAATVLLHLVATAMLYLVCRSTLKSSFARTVAVLLFGLNPVHVEAVDWISGATEPLCAIFVLLSFGLYLRMDRSGLFWPASLLSLALALLAKETAIALPGVILVFEYLLGSREGSRAGRLASAIRAAVPYGAVAAAYLGVRQAVLGGLAHRQGHTSVLEAVFTVPSVLVLYLRHLALPVNLSVFYNVPAVANPAFREFWVPLAALAVTAAAFLFLTRGNAVAQFFAWFALLFLLPSLAVLLYGTGEFMHDRYLYLPSAGFCALVALAVGRIRSQRLQIALVVLLSCFYAGGTIREGRYWGDAIALNARGLEIAPGNPIAMQNLGVELMGAGRANEAIPYFRQVLEREPREEPTLFALGLCYYNQNAVSEAESYFRRAIDALPSDPKAHLFLGNSLAKEERFPEAETEIRKGIHALRPPNGYPGYHIALAEVLQNEGKIPEALQEFRTELMIDPESQIAAASVSHLERLSGGRGN